MSCAEPEPATAVIVPSLFNMTDCPLGRALLATNFAVFDPPPEGSKSDRLDIYKSFILSVVADMALPIFCAGAVETVDMLPLPCT